jgi:hypothetical protein
MTRTFLACVATAVALAAAAQAENYSGSYFCNAEITTGFYFNEAVKRWEPSRFQPNAKFVVGLTFVRTEVLKFGPSLPKIPWDHYNVTITDAGTDSKDSCTKVDNIPGDTVVMMDGLFACHAGLMEYRFNMTKHRFLTAYLRGYLEDDTNNDTPALTMGVCTKIN